MTGFALSVVPATTCTGEVTEAPFAGSHMVTEGDAGFRVQGAVAADAIPAAQKISKVRSKKAWNDEGRGVRIRRSGPTVVSRRNGRRTFFSVTKGMLLLNRKMSWNSEFIALIPCYGPCVKMAAPTT